MVSKRVSWGKTTTEGARFSLYKSWFLADVSYVKILTEWSAFAIIFYREI